MSYTVDASLHLQGVPSNIREFQQVSGAKWIKWVNPDENYPGWGFSHYLLRFHVPDSVEWAEMARGAAGARPWFDRNAPLMAKRQLWTLRPEVKKVVFTTGNEPHPPGEPEFLKRLNDFLLALVELARPYDFHLAGPNFSVGWPQVEHIKHIAEGCAALDYICLHEYDWPAVDSTAPEWRLCRYRRFYREMDRLGYKLNTLPRCLIGECILDGNVKNQAPGKGWRHLYANNPQAYVDNVMRWYKRQLESDRPQVVEAFFLFTVKGGGWESYNHDEETIMRIAKLAEQQPEPPPPPPEPPPPEPQPEGDMKIYDVSGNERDWAWLRAKYGNVEIGTITGPGWRVTELREAMGYAALLVRATPGARVARWWPDTKLPQLPQNLNQWQVQGVYATVKDEGHCDFGMGTGDYYAPDQGEKGASWIWLENNSECVKGLGMLAATNHYHLDCTFAWTEEPGPPPPPPGPDTYTLTVTIEGTGSVIADPQKAAYTAGETVRMTAIAAAGWRFDRWTDNGGVAHAPIITLTMDSDKVVMAHFVEEAGPPPMPGPTPEDIEAARAKARAIITLAQGALVDLGDTP